MSLLMNVKFEFKLLIFTKRKLKDNPAFLNQEIITNIKIHSEKS